MVFMHGLIEECLRSVPEVAHAIARDEDLVARRVARAIARGRIVVPANPRREHRLCAVGEGCRVKVNVNIGTSGARCDPAAELEKARAALAEGADALMDLSTAGDLPAIRASILALDVPVGTVPVYEAVRRAGNAADVDADLLFRVIREHCRDGVDFLTLHCGVNRETYATLTDHGLIRDEPRPADLRFLTTGSPELFQGVGSRLLGGFVHQVEQVYALS